VRGHGGGRGRGVRPTACRGGGIWGARGWVMLFAHAPRSPVRCSAALLLAMLPALAAGAIGPPPAIQVDFETGATPGDRIDVQYASRGVFFGSSTAPYSIHDADCGPNYGLPLLVTVPGAGHSGSRGVALDGCGGEVPKRGAFLVFNRLRSRVAITVYNEANTGADPFYYLRGYDIDGNLVQTAELTPIASPRWQQVVINTIDPTIAFVTTGSHFLAAEMLAVALDYDDPEAQPDLKLNMQAAPRVYAGQIADFVVSVTRFNGSDGDISLAIAGLPAGVTGSFVPTVLTGTSTDATLTLVVDPNATVDSATATITATPQSIGAGTTAHAVNRQVSIAVPFGLDDFSADVAPCTPTDVRVQIATDVLFNGSLAVQAVSSSPRVLPAPSGALRHRPLPT